ncbi:MAG: UvrD-helicase domain-containing protein [Verrucomicrobiota bacterium]
MSLENSDALDRQRFIQEIDHNFSVQASAGAGKTTLLIARVRSLAHHFPEELQHLVLVTYTNRAANEIRQRLRSQLLEDYPRGIPPQILQGMSRMFIGTIHRFCLQIIQDYALFSGFPSEIEVHSKIRPEWIEKWEPELLSSSTHDYRWISDLHRYELAWEASEKNRSENIFTSSSPSRFTLDPHALDHVTGRSAETIAFYQKAWKQFCEDLAQKKPAELPEYDGKGGKALQEAWPKATTELLQQIHSDTLAEISQTSSRIQQKRFQEGTLLFSDQIALAFTLLHRPSIRTALQQRNYRILLDEAQDTDPFQFRILLELTRPPGSPPFEWSAHETPPRPGLFSMVGDLKQSIYRDRADLQIYQNIHQKLSEPPAGEALILSQTFRCRPEIVSWVNRQFSTAFESRSNQVSYIPLDSRHPEQRGQVTLWTPPLPLRKMPSAELLRQEAQWIVEKIKSMDLHHLRATRWSEVALLAPTRKMLTAIQTACEKLRVPFKTHFDTPQHERIEYRWTVALLSLQEKPDDSFNLLGILREIFAYSDTRLAEIRRSLSAPLTLFSENTGDLPLDQLLENLRKLQKECQPLPLARVVRKWIDGLEIEERLRVAAESPSSAIEGLQTLLLRLSKNDPRPRAEQVQQLIDDLSTTAPDPSTDNPDAIQLMTIKKSKGLQWDCVILPFLGATSGEGRSTRSHPSIEWFTPPYENPVITLSKGNSSPHAEEEEEKQKTKFDLERQRLYYVACTRSRHTLILIDDSKRWTKILASGEPRLSSPNAYEALHSVPDEKYPGDALHPTTPLTVPELTPDPTLQKSAQEETLPEFDPWKFAPLKTVEIRKKITPSGLKQSSVASSSAVISSSSGGRLYGTLWHSLMDSFPWKKETASQNHFIAQALQTISDPALKTRFQTEWELFQKTPLFPLLCQLDLPIYSEIPYTDLHPKTVEEGQIDLILQQPHQIQIIDWKTDGLTSVDFEKQALPSYTLQLKSYQKILQKFFSLPITSTIYHTPTAVLWNIQ